MNCLIEEITKNKRKEYNKKTKSNDKHLYKLCLIREKLSNRYFLAEYCILSGEICEFWLFGNETVEDGHYRVLFQNELLEKYKNIEVREVEDIFKDNFIR